MCQTGRVWGMEKRGGVVNTTEDVYRYPTRILSHNHYHLHMCICEGIIVYRHKKITLEFTVTYQDSKFHRFYTFTFRQRVSITDLSRNPVHTGTPQWTHTLCYLTTTSLTFVSSWDLGPNGHPKIATTHEMSPNNTKSHEWMRVVWRIRGWWLGFGH